MKRSVTFLIEEQMTESCVNVEDNLMLGVTA
jgi:hypothetical protein